jgi:hypothetical protein
VHIHLHTETRSTGKSKAKYTIYMAHLDHQYTPPYLTVFSENIASKLGNVFGGEDIQVGLPAVDRAFIIRGTEPHEAHEFFRRPGVAEALIGLQGVDASLRLDHGMIKLTRGGTMNAVDTVLERLDALVDCVLTIDEAGRLAAGDKLPRRAMPVVLEAADASSDSAADPWRPEAKPEEAATAAAQKQDTSAHW